ncbi:MAG: hypothetical protein JJ863_26060 [Deltaproteobacteria bacterium]|nr:hypothetical protein [Deltaproteobacteria bacterium]
MRRSIPLALIALLATAPAAADAPIVLLAGDAPQMEALASALQLAIAGDGWRVVPSASVEGSTALQRAATAQAAAQQAGARATLWVEQGPEEGVLVRLVDAEGESPRHAPLPTTLELADPRAFAAVAASLLDELVSPPQRLRIRVQVSVEAEDGEFVADGGSARVVAGTQSAEAVLGEQPVEVIVEPEPATIVSPQSEVEAELEQAAAEVEAELEEASAEVEAELEEAAAEVEAELEEAAAEVEAELEGTEAEADGWWFGLDFAPFVGASSVPQGRGRRSLSLGVLGTLSAGVDGVALSAGLNVLTANSTGVLAAAGANWNHGTMRGAQLSAGANVNVGTFRGVQATAGANLVIGHGHGAQLSAGLNLATGAFHGVQATSGVNYARGGSGLQVGSLNIQNAEYDGFQVGVVNISRGTKFSLGLINVVRGGRTHLELTYGADGFGFAMVKHGARRWHWIYSIGGRPPLGAGEDAVLAAGIGVGGHFPMTERFALDLDFVSHYLHDFQGTDELPEELGSEILSSLRLVGQLALHQRFALVFGVSLNLLTTYADESSYVPWAIDLGTSDVASTPLDIQQWRNHLWPSVFVGVRAF